MILSEFGLEGSSEPKSAFLLNASFQRKLGLLEQLGTLGGEDAGKLKRFQLLRNRLFHKPLAVHVPHLNQELKEEIMNAAIEAADVAYERLAPARTR